jgi:hypothetical protein
VTPPDDSSRIVAAAGGAPRSGGVRRSSRAPRLLSVLVLALAACAGAEAPSAPPVTSPANPAPSAPAPSAPLPPATRAGEPLQTDSLAYTAVPRSGTGSYRTYGFRVVARFTNHMAAPVYLASCGPTSTSPTYDIRLVGDTTGAGFLGSIFSRLWACVGHDRQLEVLPGATRTDTLDLTGPSLFDGATGQPFGKFDGRVRLVYGVQTCRGDGACPLPPEAGTSNVFDVTVAR